LIKLRRHVAGLAAAAVVVGVEERLVLLVQVVRRLGGDGAQHFRADVAQVGQDVEPGVVEAAEERALAGHLVLPLDLRQVVHVAGVGEAKLPLVDVLDGKLFGLVEGGLPLPRAKLVLRRDMGGRRLQRRGGGVVALGGGTHDLAHPLLRGGLIDHEPCRGRGQGAASLFGVAGRRGRSQAGAEEGALSRS
jgi:hypothetical protein